MLRAVAGDELYAGVVVGDVADHGNIELAFQFFVVFLFNRKQQFVIFAAVEYARSGIKIKLPRFVGRAGINR